MMSLRSLAPMLALSFSMGCGPTSASPAGAPADAAPGDAPSSDGPVSDAPTDGPASDAATTPGARTFSLERYEDHLYVLQPDGTVRYSNDFLNGGARGTVPGLSGAVYVFDNIAVRANGTACSMSRSGVLELPNVVDAVQAVRPCHIRRDATVHCRISTGGYTEVPELKGATELTVNVPGSSAQVCGLLPDRSVRCAGDPGGTWSANDLGAGLVDIRSLGGMAGSFICALRTNGTVQCKGSNSYGELGNPAVTARESSTPVDVAGLSDVVSIASGSHSTCALRADGTVWCWGANANGELGDGGDSTYPQPAHPKPQQVPGVSGAIELRAGQQWAAVRLGDGSFQAWGWVKAPVTSREAP